MQPIRVLIVDPREIRRQGLCCLLKEQPTIDIVGEARDRHVAAACAAKDRPSVIVVRWEAAEQWADTLTELGRAAPESHVLLLVVQPLAKSALLERAVELGVMGLVSDNDPLTVLLRAIKSVASGEAWLDRQLTSRALRRAFHHQSRRHELRDAEHPLTRRENQVIHLIAKGQKNKQIAAALSISHATVRNHLSAIFRKVGVSSRLELMAHVYRFGMAG